MRKKGFNSTARSFYKSFFSFSLILGTSLPYIESTQAQGAEVPGLPVARLSFSSLSSNIDDLTPTGTEVGGRVLEIKRTLEEAEESTSSIIYSTRNLYERVINEVNQYYSLISKIEAKLQLGTTPSNPKAIELQNKAALQLNQITSMINHMNELSTELSQTSQGMKGLSSEVNSLFYVPGALDEDHANLIKISEEITKADSLLTRIISNINGNTRRQGEWLSQERNHFASLSSAIEKGNANSLNPRAQAPQYPVPVALPHYPAHLKEEHYPLHRKVSLEHRYSSEKPISASVPLSPAAKRGEQEMGEPEETSDSNIIPLSSITKSRAISEKSASSDTEALNKPLSKIDIKPHPEIKPVEEASAASQPINTQAQEATLSSSTELKNRAPLAILEPGQDIQNHKWYLFSSAQRGLKGPSKNIEIINTIGTKESFERSEEVKNILVKMGIQLEQIKIVNAKPEEGSPGQIAIYGGK